MAETTPTAKCLVAPFAYPGGKRRVVDMVWSRFGDVDNYVEPFCGSAAMLLGAPPGKRYEIINDLNGFIVNFWRAVKADPEAVARWADYPVSELDLNSRHGWLFARADRLTWCLEDPDFFDAKIAGWWVWGMCCVPNGFCCQKGNTVLEQGVHFGTVDDLRGFNRRMPDLRGDHAIGLSKSEITDGVSRTDFIRQWIRELSCRLRDVKIACGDWVRILRQPYTTKIGLTAIFFDPPYSAPGVNRAIYMHFDDVAIEVAKWCAENGDNPKLRIALCGYEGEHNMPEGWTCVGWHDDRPDRHKLKGKSIRERIWFSPHCLPGRTVTRELFDAVEENEATAEAEHD